MTTKKCRSYCANWQNVFSDSVTYHSSLFFLDTYLAGLDEANSICTPPPLVGRLRWRSVAPCLVPSDSCRVPASCHQPAEPGAGSPAPAVSPDSGDDASLSPINVDIEVQCLICSTGINLRSDQYCDVYLDNIVTAHSRLPVSEKLGRVLR